MSMWEEVGMEELLGERWNFVYGLIPLKIFTIMPSYGPLKKSRKYLNIDVSHNKIVKI